MRKTGRPLDQLTVSLPIEILDRLREEFSITTAEELISAAANRASHLRRALDLSLNEWIDLVLPAYEAVEPAIRDFLAERLVLPFGKGAVLNETENLPRDYKNYLS